MIKPNYKHKGLADGRWQIFSIAQQMANIGSEVERAISWKNRDKKNSMMAVDRALELLDLTIDDPRNRKRLKEIMRVREMVADYFYFDNIYGSTDQSWHNYFYPFMHATALELAEKWDSLPRS